MRRKQLLLAAGVLILVVGATLGIGFATAADPVNHGMTLTKGCASPTNVGQPYACSYSFRNHIDDAQDTLTVSGLVDVVQSAGGAISSGNVFSQLRMVVGPYLPGYSTPPTCTGGTGDGTVANPWVGATMCTLPFGSRIGVLPFSFYTVTAADFNLPGHKLSDAARLTWNDLCNDPIHTGNSNCNPNPPTVGAASQTIVTQLKATTTTDIHNAAHDIVTVVPAGTTVHDSATVSAGAGNPVPTGSVTFDWFTNNTCEGSPASTSGTFALVNGSVDAVSFAKGPLTAGLYGFKAHYLGSSTYAPSDGACEPLRVVDANIQITPNGVNRVGQTHTFTGHVNVNDGTGFVSAPAGTTINFTVNNSPAGSCTTVNGTGSCSISLTSVLTGLWMVRASSTVSVAGLSLTRTTDGVSPNSPLALKRWVNAKIAITPNETNPVGQPHTFVVTLQKDMGDGNGFVPAADEHVTVTLTDSNGAVHSAPTGSCTNAGANTDANGQCTITVNSQSAGKVTGHAASTLSVNGSAPFTVETDGGGLNSGDAVKTYVDANIQITPNGTNRVGQNHVFTAHVNVNNGNGLGFQNAPDGTQITFSKTGPGTFTTANPCTVTGGSGSCSVTLSSAVTGVSTVSATSTLSVGGLSLTRTTNGVGANSGPAVKTWVNAKISIVPNATNPVGQPHTFTVTLEKDTGTGAFVPAAGEHVNFQLTDSNGASSMINAAASTCDDGGANTDSNGRCVIVFNSATAGKVTGHAFATLSVNGSAPFTVETDGAGLNSGDAVKTYVDANIQITPSPATNRVGQPHTFTAHVNVNTGTGGFQNAPAGTQITFTIDGGPGTPNPPTSCTTSGSTGSCQTTITSSTTGVTTVSAHTTVSVGGVSLTRHTNGTGANSGPAVKTWVNAKISIAPNATNEVGQPHTFFVTLQKDTGTGVFVPAAGEHVNFTLTNSNGAAAVLDAATSTCDDAGPNTNGSGQCTLVFASATPGIVRGHASATLSIGSPATQVSVETDGLGLNSGDAFKTFVDANIQITPDGVNRVGQAHTFTAHVNVNTGNGAFQNAPDGTQISFTIDGGGPGGFTSSNPCTTAGGTGSCSITLTSGVTGVTVVSAHTTVSVGGVSLTRHTNGIGANSAPATKRWVNAKITIAPDDTNQVGQSHTFMVTLWKDTGTGIFVPAPGEHVDISLTPTLGATVVNPTGTCLTAGANTDQNGQCSITFTSNTTGKVTGHARSTLAVAGSAPFTVETDNLLLNSGDAVKTFVNARIAIAPDATNQVGQPHVFTVTLQEDPGTGTFVAAAGEHVNFTLTSQNGAAAVVDNAASTCDDAGANTNANGQCTIVFNSASPGKVIGHASSTLQVGPPPSATITVHTDGIGLNSPDAVKTYVDANIQITPNGTNRVGQAHTFTAHVNVNSGNGGGYVPAPDGTEISFTVDSGPGAFTSPNPCVTVGGTGSCSITLNSAQTGVSTVSAHSTLLVGGLSLTRHTNGTGANSAPAVKTWVNAKISITPNATNQVNQSHTFTVTLHKDPGTGVFVPAAGEHVTVTLTNSNGAVHTAPTGTCTNAGANTDSNGQCTITFTSATGGKVTGRASATLSVGPAPPAVITVQTDGTGLNSGDAVKTFVDANIQITPQNDTNPIGQTHTFTAHVNVNDGSGAGFQNAPAGTPITFTKVSGPGAFTTTNPCVTVGTTGSCTIDLVSNETGLTVVSASTTVTLAGLSVTRTTNGAGANSGPAQKTWASAKIRIEPDATNEVGQPHTFTVTLSRDNGAGFVPAQNEHVDFTLTNQFGAVAALDAAASTCDNAGPNTNGSGQCTIVFASPTAGRVIGHAFSTVSINGTSVTVSTNGVAPNSGNAVKTFVDANIQIFPNATNPVGTTHTFTAHVNVNRGDGNGYVNAPAGTQISFTKDSGVGSFTTPTTCSTAGTTGSCTVTVTSAVAGSTVVSAHVTTSVGGVSLTRHTNGAGANSGPATKVWVAARILITPDDVNEIGQPHTFTVTLQKDSGSGFAPAPNEHVDVTLTDSNGAVHTTPTGTCTNTGPNTNGSGQCTITFASPTAGKVTGHATATLMVGGFPVTVETNGLNGNSVDAVKTYVDANIQITPPNATNRVGDQHTFTAHVNVNPGTGFVNAPNGTTINFTVNGSPAGSCQTAGGTGSCSISLTSAVTGVWTVRASTSVVVGGLTLSRSTDGVAPNSGPAMKTWVNAKIAITPDATNRIGQPHTFTVTLQKDTGTGSFVAAGGETVTVTLANSNGAVASPAGPFTGTTNASGQFQVTFASATGGKVTGTASSTLSVNGSAPFTVSTNGVTPNSGPAVKTFVDARISITPNATNEVGQPHTFTVTLLKNTGDGAGYVAAQGEHVDVTLTDTNGAVHTAPTGTCTNAGANTNASGQCTITFNSPSAGKVTGHASSTLTVGGVVIAVQTNGLAGNSGDAVKTYVDANIQITPPTDTNPVGTNHVFTAHVNVNAGNGSFVNAPDGTSISFTIDSGPGSFTTTNPCTTTGGTGSCSITLTSATVGTTVVSAHVTTSVGGLSLTRHTNGTGANSGPANKTWVGAKIKITPDATNEVGQPHTFTVTLEKNTGAGFVPAQNEHVDVTLTNSNGAAHTAPTGTCTNAGANTNASGQCTITFASPTAGKVTGHASATLTIGGLPLTVETNGVAPNSGDAVKTFVDANIQITPNGVNRVGQAHVFTAHVNVNTGNGAGYVSAPAGTQISFTIDSGPGSFTTTNPCTTIGTTGSCTITLSSSTTGTTIVSAHSTLSVGGLSLTRHTNGTGANSAPAQKKWVNAKISITPNATNRIGQPHTFTVTLQKDTGTGSFVAAAGETVTVTLTNSSGAVASPAGPFTGTTNASGQFQVTFNSQTTGKVTGHASSTLSVNGSAPFTVHTDGTGLNSGDAVKTYVNAKIRITPDATNEVGQPHTFTATLFKDLGNGAGFVAAANERVTVALTNSNGAAFTSPTGTCTNAGANTNASGQCTITFTSPTAGKVTARASSTLSVGGVSITVQTDGTGGNSVDAVKTFVDANIQLNPPTATNNLGEPHVFTAHVNVNAGAGSFANAPAGTVIGLSIVSGPGTLSASSCTTVGTTGSCTVTLTNTTTPGTTTVRATTTLSVGGVTLTRTTADGKPGDSPHATKTWVSCPPPGTFTLTGNTSSTGTFGNIRQFTATNSVQVKASAFNRSSGGAWTTAYLGSYSSGLGVTNRTESGADPNHKVDNVDSVDYVLFEFSGPVAIDEALLDAVTSDSDISVWIGNKTDPFNNHQTLSDSFLTSLGFTEENLTDSAATRWADINAGAVQGNILVIAALASDTSPEDQFKINKLETKCPNQCVPGTATLTGNSASTGTAGNIRQFAASNGAEVKVSAFNRSGGGTWTTAWLGSYSPGLGVTNNTENGADPNHKVDNVGSVDYVLFEFSSSVVVDRAFLDAITTDSDISVWIGTKTNPFNNHQTLSDSFLASLGFTEENLTASTAARWADINAVGVVGNILVIAAQASDTTPEDQFKISKLDLCK